MLPEFFNIVNFTIYFAITMLDFRVRDSLTAYCSLRSLNKLVEVMHSPIRLIVLVSL